MPKSILCEIIKARELLKSLGGRVAGGYLRKRGYTLGEALLVLGLPDRFNVAKEEHGDIPGLDVIHL